MSVVYCASGAIVVVFTTRLFVRKSVASVLALTPKTSEPAISVPTPISRTMNYVLELPWVLRFWLYH